MTPRLTLPELKFEKSYRDYIVELGDEERYPFPLDWDFDNFSQIVQKSKDFSEGHNIPDGFVPSTTFWLVEGDTLVGVSNLRHTLNAKIRREGGHIGLGIRPSFRGKGYGAKLLKLTLQQARHLGISEIQIHCHKDNVASVRMIQSVACRLDSEGISGSDGRLIQRYVTTDI